MVYSYLRLSPFIKNVKCVKEIEILVEQQSPQGFFVRDHAGLAIHCYLKLTEVPLLLRDVPTLDFCLGVQCSGADPRFQ